jgi:hypothetical protein
MAGQFNSQVAIQGKVEIQNGTDKTTILLDGNTGDATFGGNGQDGNLQLRSSAGNNTIFLGGENGDILVGSAIKLEGKSNRIFAKDLQLRSSTGNNAIFLGGEDGDILVGSAIKLEGKSSRIFAKDLQLRSSAGDNTIFLDGENSTILLGNALKLDGKNGSIVLKDWTLSVPDYVFEEDYKLRELDELRSYIDRQKHLPEIPSAQTIRAEGINLSEFCMSLLKKIEELSLYVLQQHTAIQQQSDRLTQLEHSAGMEQGERHV